MKITVSGEEREYPNGLNITQWLKCAEIPNQEVALIQVNGKDVLPSKRSTTYLKDGDEVQVLYFLGDS